MSCLEFENEFGRRARVWIDDLPRDALLNDETVREAHVFACGAATVRRARVAIEIFRPFGASFHYGLLGGTYQPAAGNSLEVTVPVDTALPTRKFPASLARSLDTVTIGSLPEYAKAICGGLEQADVITRPCGRLALTCMAQGKIGSAAVVFSSLARALLLALCQAEGPASLEEVMALLDGRRV